jgi:hypothetical protein
VAQTDDIVRLILQITGQQEAQGLTAQLDKLTAEIRDLEDARQRGTVSGERYREEFRRLQAEATKTAAALDRLGDVADDATGHAGRRSGLVGLSQGLLQGSRAVQDFQAAGLMGITNNIELLAMSLGIGAGMAGVATLAAVAIQQLLPWFNRLGQQAATTTDEIETLTARIKELEDKPVKLAIDRTELEVAQRKLDELRAAKAAFDAEQKQQDTIEGEIGKAITGAIVETPGGQEAMAAARGRFAGQFADNTEPVTKLRERIARLRAGRPGGEEELTAATAARRQFDTQGNREREAKAREFLERLQAEENTLQTELVEALAAGRTAGARRFDSIRQAAVSGQGGAQQRGIAGLTEALRRTGAGGLADQIMQGVEGVNDRRDTAELTAQGKENEAAALAALEATKREKAEAKRQSDVAFDLMEAEDDIATRERKEAQRAAERQRKERERQIGAVAGDVAPTLAPEIANVLARNGGRLGEQQKGAIVNEIAARIGGAPGVNDDNAIAVAAEVLRQTIEQYQAAMWQQQQETIRMMQMLQNQFGGMRAGMWNAGRMRPMAPTNIQRRPF